MRFSSDRMPTLLALLACTVLTGIGSVTAQTLDPLSNGLGEGISLELPTGDGNELIRKSANVEAQLISRREGVQPGQDLLIGLRLNHDAHWHTYYRNPGENGVGEPTRIQWQLPDGFAASEIQWPEPKRLESAIGVNYVYEGEIVLPVRLTVPDSIAANEVTLRATVTWLSCEDGNGACVPSDDVELALTLPVIEGAPPVNEKWAGLFDTAMSNQATVGAAPADGADRAGGSLTFPLALVFAFLGGLILNLMPCVFPVLSIKILGFVNQAGSDRSKIAKHGVLFAVGVLASFAVLAGLLVMLRSGVEGLGLASEQVGWGFQLQEPLFVAALALVMFAVGLNLAGVFDVGFGVMAAAGKAQSKVGGGKPSSGGAFFSGVLATALATPCTAPFMAPAIGYALTLSAWQTMAIFLTLGLGMAVPYVLLSFFPGWLKMLPRPGAWMETFKQVMAFPMFATALWLMWVYGNQLGQTNGMLLLGGSMILLGIGLWAFGRWNAPERSATAQWGGRVAAIIFVALAALVPTYGGSLLAEDLQWEPFSQARAEQLRDEGNVVFVDFTAKWCATCQWNKQTVIYSDTVKEAIREHDVKLLRADWTKKDPAITRALEQFGHNGVPLYVIYSPKPGSEPDVRGPVITRNEIAEAIRDASPGIGSAAASR